MLENVNVSIGVPVVPSTSVVVTVDAGAAALRCRTQTVSPFAIVVAVAVKTPLQPTECSPPLTASGIGTLMPRTVTGSEVTTRSRGAPVASANAIGSGVTSMSVVATAPGDESPAPLNARTR